MAQYTYRANLSAATFPLLSRKQGRTVIVRQQDQNYVPNLASSESEDKGAGVPQLYYMHNVLPTNEGYTSVGFSRRVDALPASGAVDEVLVTSGTRNTRLVVTADGHLFAYVQPYYYWVPVTIDQYPGLQLSVATLGGITYILATWPGAAVAARCYTFNFDTLSLVPQALTGLDMQTIRGIAASNGYMIAWTKTAVAWSSTVDVTDFEPSLSTGAGGGEVEQAAGEIVVCTYTTHGFIIYTTANIVAAVYQGNSRYPFQLRELVNSGGISHKSQVALEANTGIQYAYTTSGLQAVTAQKAELIFPAITDFIAGRELEDFDETTNTFTDTLGTMIKRIAMVSDRFLVVSYGIFEYTHALVVDVAIRRYGKLKITHTKCFEWRNDINSPIVAPFEAVAFLRANGAIYTLTPGRADTPDAGVSSVALFGKYQYVRQRLIELHEVAVETVNPLTDEFPFECLVRTELDREGPSLFLAGYPAVATGQQRIFNFRAVGTNVSLMFKGVFDLVSLVLTYTVHGGR